MNKKFQHILLHVLGSIAFLSIPIIASPDFNFDLTVFSVPPFQKNFFLYILLLIFFYLNYYFLIPKFYFGNKKTLYFSFLIICCLCIMILPELFFDGNKPDFENRRLPPPDRNHFLDFREIMSFGFILAISFLLKLSNQIKEITNEKLKSEVQFLKAQINPHFLFNTLNSLFALTLTKSNEAPNAVLKLSSLMRYVVTESTVDFVPLLKEIEYINDYLSLQKLRLNQNTNINFIVTGTINSQKIAPLLLIPFIENAFKYGVNPDENTKIIINLNCSENNLELDVENTIATIVSHDIEKSEKGIVNTKKRLEIVYPNLHSLQFGEKNGVFKVSLKIKLND